jgi:UDP-N-acetylmuramate-alanine ligase
LIQDLEDAENYLMEFLEEGDFFLTLGAGDVWKAGENIMKRIKKP